MLVTVYFHRTCSHRSVSLAPSVHRIARFLSWYLIAMVPREFAAVHRKHHAKVDTEEDPHSPANHGALGVLFNGLALYRKEAQNMETLEKYGKGLVTDKWEAFYLKHRNMGIFLFLGTLVALLGWKGVLLWGMMMIWIPLWAAGVINGLGHHVGYRNYATKDLSTNIVPWGLWIGGEELHNNHHAYPLSPKFSKKPFEIDLGWGFIKVLSFFKLAEARRERIPEGTAGFLVDSPSWLSRFHAAAHQSLRQELKGVGQKHWTKAARLLESERASLSSKKQQMFDKLINHPQVSAMWKIEQDLRKFWDERSSFTFEAYEKWKKSVLETSFSPLHDFASKVPAPKA